MRQLLCCVCLLGLNLIDVPCARADEAAIREFIRAYTEALSAEDLEAVAVMWTEDASHVDRSTGVVTEGRDAISSDLANIFKSDQIQVTGAVQHIKMITPEVANVTGTTVTSVPDEQPSETQFSAVIVKAGEGWQFDHIEESPQVVPATAADALRELDWLEGSWVDEGEETVVSTFRWSSNRTFLVRSIALVDADEASRIGTQIIGWDPRSQEIRSWTFNSDGSFGDGNWSRHGEDWLVKSSQTTADGQAASGTFVLTLVDENSLSMRLIGHEVEGEPQPAGESAILRRQPDDEPVSVDAVSAQ